MRWFSLLLLAGITLQANEMIQYFQKDPGNELLCRDTYNGYLIVSQHNASLVKVSNINFIKLKDQNRYLNVQGCKIASNKTSGIIF